MAEVSEVKGISRRDTLKVFGASVGIYAVDRILNSFSKGKEPPSVPQDVPSHDPELLKKLAEFNFPESTFEGKCVEYSGKERKIIDLTKKNFNVSLKSPTPWIDGKENLPWDSDQLASIYQALADQPFDYVNRNVSVDMMLLARLPGTEGGAGGIHRAKELQIFIPEKYDVHKKLEGVPGKYYENNAKYISAVVIHELTHGYLFLRPDVVDDWSKLRGWKKINGNWQIEDSSRLLPEKDPVMDPYEDICFSIQRAYANFQSLPDDIKGFLSKTEPWASWKPVVEGKTSIDRGV